MRNLLWRYINKRCLFHNLIMGGGVAVQTSASGIGFSRFVKICARSAQFGSAMYCSLSKRPGMIMAVSSNLGLHNLLTRTRPFIHSSFIMPLPADMIIIYPSFCQSSTQTVMQTYTGWPNEVCHNKSPH